MSSRKGSRGAMKSARGREGQKADFTHRYDTRLRTGSQDMQTDTDSAALETGPSARRITRGDPPTRLATRLDNLEARVDVEDLLDVLAPLVNQRRDDKVKAEDDFREEALALLEDLGERSDELGQRLSAVFEAVGWLWVAMWVCVPAAAWGAWEFVAQLNNSVLVD